MQPTDTDTPHKRNTLTAKQSRFAVMVARGVSLTVSYFESYDTQASGTSLRVQAWRLSKNPKVAERIQELCQGSLGARLDSDRLNRDWVLGRLQEEATDPNSTGSARVRALEILARAHGLFDNTVVAVEPRSPEEIEEELVERLTAIMPMISTQT